MAGSVLKKSEKPHAMIFCLRRPKRWPEIRINMIPMLNLALLLLVFCKVSAFFAPRPRLMEISIPSKYDILNPEPIPATKLLRLFVDENDSFYYQVEKSMDRPAKVDFEQLAETITALSYKVEDPVMLLKLDPKASYNSMVRVIDKIQCIEREIANNRTYARMANPGQYIKYYHTRFILRDMSAGDELLLARAKQERRN